MKVYPMWPFTKRNVPAESSTAEIPVIHPTTPQQEADVSAQSNYPDVKGRRLPLGDTMSDLATTKVDVDITPKIIRRAELALNLVPSLLAADAKILEGL